MQNQTGPQSNQNPNRQSGTLICWRSVATGVLVALMLYITLSALGAGIGGLTAAHMINRGEEGSGLFAAAGLWMGLSAVIAVFLGSYFGTRYSDANHVHVGGSQGVVVAAIFFILISSGTALVPGSYSNITANLNGSIVVPDSDAAASAKAVGEAGWLVFVTFALGLVASVVGGVEGARGNLRRPFSRTR